MSYSFPSLKPAEILTCLADLQIPMSHEDLEKPSTNRMLAVFEQFTDILMGVSRDQFSQPNFAAMEILEYPGAGLIAVDSVGSNLVMPPDLHQESITILSFFRQLARLIVEVGVSDFSIRDIIKPEAGRIRRILSAVINFAKFREERLSVFEECTKKSSEYIEERKFLTDKIQDIADRVNTIRLNRAEQEPLFQKRREDNIRLTSELRELKRIQTALASDIDSLKKTKNESSEKLSNTQFLLAQCKQDCTRIRSRIVQSPEKLQQAISDMNQSVHSEKQNIAAVDKRARDLHLKIQMFTAIDNDAMSNIKLMEECEAEMIKANAAKARVQEERENIENKQLEMKNTNIREQQLNRLQHNIEEKISRLAKHEAAKREARDSKLSTINSEYESIAKERERNMLKAEANYRRVIDEEQKATDLKKKSEAEIAALKKMQVTLQGKVDYYKNELIKHMDVDI
ncbi:kinetochore-associated Ndc80 complex subunit nuf2 [Irineochytrium annulatum]|nr:kinetochore-associated Ndc80 complex subunit nuf2 [Irineochytrium annulatum]